jgi:hypothetical protein
MNWLLVKGLKMQITNKYNLPQPIVDAIKNDDYDSEGSDITASGLGSPPQKTALEKLYWDDLEEDAIDRLWALFGQIGHGILERAAIGDDTRVVEKRFFAEVAGWLVSGKLDLLEHEGELGFLEEGVLSDYKIMSAWEIVFGLREEKVAQLNTLAWLCKENGVGVKRLQIVALLRDWSRGKALADKNYPQRNIEIIPLPFWSWDKTRAYIEERVREHQLARELLPRCSEEDRWHQDDKYAVMKEGRKSAVRVLGSRREAEEYAVEKKMARFIGDNGTSEPPIELNKGISIEKRPGEDTRCLYYCSVSGVCPQWQDELKKQLEG